MLVIRDFYVNFAAIRKIKMVNGLLVPDFIFESSWEVCNKVGGIYTVLSTRAKTLQEMMRDKIMFIGPDCWGEKPCQYFVEDETLFGEWRKEAGEAGLNLKVGRWNIPGEPIAILVDFKPYFAQKDRSSIGGGELLQQISG